MEQKLQLVKELYDITLKQEQAINLGLIPRFLRLVEERDEVIKQIESLNVSDSDENINNEIKELASKIKELDDKNLASLGKQKKEAKEQVEKVMNARKIMLEGFDAMPSVTGVHIDNKQ